MVNINIRNVAVTGYKIRHVVSKRCLSNAIRLSHRMAGMYGLSDTDRGIVQSRCVCVRGVRCLTIRWGGLPCCRVSCHGSVADRTLHDTTSCRTARKPSSVLSTMPWLSTQTSGTARQPSQTPNSCSHGAVRALHDQDSRTDVRGRCASVARDPRRGSLWSARLLSMPG